jgi:plasmid stabilization system protein ParE
VEDLEHMFQRIEKVNPTATRETVKTIYDGCEALTDFPHRAVPDV